MSDPFHILIAEDDENDVFLMQRALAKIGLSLDAHFVTDGEFLIAYLSGTGEFADRNIHPLPDFVITDIKLQRKTGFDALQWIREQLPFQMLPVLVLSASDEDRDRLKAQRLGCSGYLVKPTDQQILAEQLNRFIQFWGPFVLSRRKPR